VREPEPPSRSASAHSVAPDFLVRNFESERFSTQRFLDPVSLGLERGCQALAPGLGYAVVKFASALARRLSAILARV
jgi:hypothetical protein